MYNRSRMNSASSRDKILQRLQKLAKLAKVNIYKQVSKIRDKIDKGLITLLTKLRMQSQAESFKQST